MACRGERNVGYVEAGQNPHHAGNSLCFGGVNGLDEAVGNGSVADFYNQHVTFTQVIHILGAARCLIIGVHTDHAFFQRVYP